jgi:hypothetical protein
MHAVAVRLRDDGVDDRLIGVALGIDELEVPTLLKIADSKLTNLMAIDDIELGLGPLDQGSPTIRRDDVEHKGR